MLPFERQELIKTLSNLPFAQFEQIVFTLNLPGGIIPTSSAPQGERAAALLAWVEKTGPGLNTLRELLSQVLGEELPILPTICPYKGLSYFDCNDEDYKYFYGREALTQTLLEKVTRDNFLAIVGASGSGKSSVLRAGLLQRLKDKGGYEIRILFPGEHPLQNLARAFVDEDLDRLDRAEQQQKAKKLIQAGAEGLCALVETSDSHKLVLVVDQFEESFTLCQDRAERQAFFETLLGGLEAAGSKLCLILAMRSDFLGKCFEGDDRELAEKVKTHLESILSMTIEGLTQAITEPARQTGITLEAGLTEALLKDVEQSPGALPLLQYTLTELWHRQQNNQLRLSVYHQLGGVTGTLKQRADEVYDSLTLEQQQTARHIFLSLTQLGEGAEDTRRRITQGSLFSTQHSEEEVISVIKQLADANLVVTDEQASIEGLGSATVNVTHEALIRNWPKLRKWLDDNRDLLWRQRKIELAAEEWSSQNRKPGYLLQGLPLIEAKQFRKDHSVELPLSRLADRFVKVSLRQRWINRLKVSSGLIVLLPIVDYSFHRRNVEQHYSKLNGTDQVAERESALFLTQHCSQRNGDMTGYLIERTTGQYCRSLANRIFSKEADLENAELNYVNLELADLEAANLSDASLNNANLANANLANANLTDVGLNNAILDNVNLANASLSHAYLRFSSFYSTELGSADLGSAELIGASFSYAYLNNANLNNADLFKATFQDTALANADLTGVDLTGAYLLHTTLRDANLTSANLTSSRLATTSLVNADLSNADLSFADLSNTDLSNTNLRSVILGATDLRETRNLTSEQLTLDESHTGNWPYLCNTALPPHITIDPDRDCDQLRRVMLERYEWRQDKAEERVKAIREYQWGSSEFQ